MPHYNLRSAVKKVQKPYDKTPTESDKSDSCVTVKVDKVKKRKKKFVDKDQLFVDNYPKHVLSDFVDERTPEERKKDSEDAYDEYVKELNERYFYAGKYNHDQWCEE